MRRSLKSFVIIAVFAACAAACPTAEPVTECVPATNEPCFEGYICDDVSKTCLRACSSSTDCIGSQICDLVTDPNKGRCVSGNSTSDGGADGGGGDSATD